MSNKNQNKRMIETLRSVPLFADTLHSTDESPTCLAILDRGETIDLADGQAAAREGDPAVFCVVLSGTVRVTKRIGDGMIDLATWGPGEFFGELPLILGTPFIASGYAVGPTTLLRLPNDVFWKLLKSCTATRQVIIQTMAQRMRNLETITQSQEQLQSLGTLAAGLAHELNNPAAAMQRAAAQLRSNLDTNQDLAVSLGAESSHDLLPAVLAQLTDEVVDIAQRFRAKPPLDALSYSDYEDAVAEWLEDWNITNGWELAATFVQSGLDVAWLDLLRTRVPLADLNTVLVWLGSHLAAEGLLTEVEQSASRIVNLVDAVIAYGDHEHTILQETDVHATLESALVLLDHKARDHTIDLLREYAPGLPCIQAFGQELVQLWTNLIDNAIDAVATSEDTDRRVWVRTAFDGYCVFVSIIDNGPGIPPAVQQRIWEPFFTTKGVGRGTGLGLATSYRIAVRQHHGEIQVRSQPGLTRFDVRLPLEHAHQQQAAATEDANGG